MYQFFLFGRYGNEEELVQTVLKDIPKQVTNYMDKMNIEPDIKKAMSPQKVREKEKDDGMNSNTKNRVMQDITNTVPITQTSVGKQTYSSLPVLDQDNRI